MAERTHIPSSPVCGLWETLLADALDGLLKPEDEAAFNAHMSVCPACAALLDEARKGREWLEFLSTEPEAPEGLLDRILAQTGPGQIAGYGLVTPGGNVLPMPPASTSAWQRPGFMGHVRRFTEPRLLMTAAMAFFSISLTLYLTGFRFSNVRLADLRPTAVRSFPSEARSFFERRLTMASPPIIRYYVHLRFVNEVESRVRELRRATQFEDRGGDHDNRQKPKNAEPGETKQSPGELPGRKDRGPRIDPPQQSGNPVLGPALNETDDFLEASLTYRERPAHSGGSERQERSTVWTA
jgi:hypothetical protein